MRTGPASPHELTYCLNVHPGEGWDDALAAIRTHVLPLRDRVAPAERFGLGLRLSKLAADALHEPATLAAFRQFLDEHDLYVFTINAFPYGTFHGQPVKEEVYRPDWRTRERVDYTIRVADIANALGGDGDTISISTVPGSYGAWINSPAQVSEMVEALMAVVAHLARLEARGGPRIALGLEPEPDCFLQTTDDVLAFFGGPIRDAGVPVLADALGKSATEAQRVIARHLGICLDTCHLALQFERLDESIRAMAAAGILISKVQISAALNTAHTAAAREALTGFLDPVYLHQVKLRHSGGGPLTAYPDLNVALDARGPDADETWRIHFHVPLYFEAYGALGSTSGELTPAFFAALRELEVAHLEIETYTFDVLPPPLRAMGIGESVARE